jgi:phage FluMu gp28-like protein
MAGNKTAANGRPFHIYSKKSPLALLLPYQAAWAQDGARFKIGCMSRQVGKDFSSGGEGVADIIAAELRGEKKEWMIAAPSERQSLMSLDKWKDWTAAFKVAISDIQEEREGSGSEALLKATKVVFPGGSVITAVPGRPDTVRGASANVLMTEFAFFENPDETWRAIVPSITIFAT